MWGSANMTRRRFGCPAGSVWRLALWLAAAFAVVATPADAADPKDDIVLGAMLAEFHLAVATSLAAAGQQRPTGYTEQNLADAVQLARLTHRQTSDGTADFDLALGAFLAFAGGLDQEAKAPLAPREARYLACQLVGADAVAFAELGRRLQIDSEDANACAKAFEKATASWNERFSVFRLGPGLIQPAGAGPLYVEIAPVFNPANEAIAAMLHESGLYDLLAERLNAQILLPSARVLLATECGGTQGFYNPDRREIGLCDERIAAWIAATAARGD
jgi:hypothetical protein